MAVKAKTNTRAEIAAKKQSYVQDEIVGAAARLFAERGYRAVTIDDIAVSIGYTKSVIYYYFDSKNEILWQIFLRIYESYFRAVESIRDQGLAPELALAQVIKRHAMNVMGKREWTAIYFREESELDESQRRQIARKKRQYDAVIEEIYDAGVAAGVFRQMPAHIAVSGILGMCNWLYVWYKEEGAFSAVQIADHYASLLSEGYSTK